ncbi:hypothetical protein VaNZ11_004270 [Volvox africanus]|uniref:SGNH hydrolase-type esterase domain-containing protein n=1 Tax=Volvox africanus TaxID=51714 RepID=A0ABQ5RWM6_9CHLO|nr:hypothetical protein VaNZ11_004270 [Volvox africanus]
MKYVSVVCIFIFIGSFRPSKCAEKVNRLTLTKSIIHHGDTAMFGRLHEKLHGKHCIRVMFIGGSVTHGHGLPNGSMPYPVLFKKELSSAFPCKGRHNITVASKGAIATDFWIDYLVGRQEVLLADFDLVVVDTAMNDVHELVMHAGRGAADPNAFIRTQTEILMSMILQESHRVNDLNDPTPSSAAACTKESNYTRIWTGVAAIWLGTSTRRTSVWRGPLPRTTDAVHVQLPVAMTHGVPYISIIDGLGPFSSTSSQQWLKNNWYVEPVKDVHPGRWGHQALAKALVHFLTEQHLYLTQLPWQQDIYSPVYCPRPPTFIDPNTLDMYLDMSPLHIPTVYLQATKPRMSRCGDWTIKSDVLGKPGLISLKVGARCAIFAFPAEVVRHPVEVGEVHVLMLKSYEHMGWLRVIVAAVPAASADGSDEKTKCILNSINGNGSSMSNANSSAMGSWSSGSTILGSRDIDCLWDERVSEARMEVVQITKPPHNDTSGQDFCLAFMFEVLGSDRAENKVKILGVTVF